MSTFSENWAQCMHGNGLPIPNVEDASEALEVLHEIHSAWENAGGEITLTIGALVAVGALTGVDETFLLAAAQVAAMVYLSASIACIASVALEDLKIFSANGELPDFVVAELNNQGVNLNTANA